MAVLLSGKVSRSTPDIDHTRTSSRCGAGWVVRVHRSVSSSAIKVSSMGGAPVGEVS
ncbi:hypothetical protein [Streptomyces sp. CA-132043]|uniref:hypothetical protein n=1 Tax=Streptomyces sp. CA-132043 TaxID=3240048 RepID=UPI003D8D78D1